jgi:hypothetical protein
MSQIFLQLKNKIVEIVSTKFVQTKTLVMMQQMCCEGFFLPKHTKFKSFLTSKEMTKTGFWVKGGDPTAIYIGYVVFAS